MTSGVPQAERSRGPWRHPGRRAVRVSKGGIEPLNTKRTNTGQTRVKNRIRNLTRGMGDRRREGTEGTTQSRPKENEKAKATRHFSVGRLIKPLLFKKAVNKEGEGAMGNLG